MGGRIERARRIARDMYQTPLGDLRRRIRLSRDEAVWRLDKIKPRHRVTIEDVQSEIGRDPKELRVTARNRHIGGALYASLPPQAWFCLQRFVQSDNRVLQYIRSGVPSDPLDLQSFFRKRPASGSSSADGESGESVAADPRNDDSADTSVKGGSGDA